MSIVELLQGYKKVDVSKVHPDIVKIADRKISHIMSRKARVAAKTRHLGRTCRGVKIIGDISGCSIYLNGHTWKYKIVEHTHRWIDNHGHGGAVGSPRDYYRKLRKK